MESHIPDEMALAREFVTLLPMLYRYIFLQLPCPGSRPSVPPNQMLAMIFLNMFPDSSMTQLASRLMVSKQQLTKIIDGLVAKDLVQRKNDQQNRRLVLLELTQKGRQFVEGVLACQARKATQMFAHIAPQSRETLLTALELLRQGLDQYALAQSPAQPDRTEPR